MTRLVYPSSRIRPAGMGFAWLVYACGSQGDSGNAGGSDIREWRHDCVRWLVTRGESEIRRHNLPVSPLIAVACPTIVGKLSLWLKTETSCFHCVCFSLQVLWPVRGWLKGEHCSRGNVQELVKCISTCNELLSSHSRAAIEITIEAKQEAELISDDRTTASF